MWYWRSPSCACDIPAHAYQYSWAPNPCWSTVYAPAPEIRAYLDLVVAEHDLGKYIRYHQRCMSAIWNETRSLWTTIFKHEITQEETIVEAEVLIYAVGRLNDFQIPSFKGQETFSGHVIHTARWPEDLEVAGKRIAVLGNGSSGMQCVGALQSGEPCPKPDIWIRRCLERTNGPEAAQVFSFCRSPTWAGPEPFGDNRDCMWKPNHLGPSLFTYYQSQKKRNTNFGRIRSFTMYFACGSNGRWLQAFARFGTMPLRSKNYDHKHFPILIPGWTILRYGKCYNQTSPPLADDGPREKLTSMLCSSHMCVSFPNLFPAWWRQVYGQRAEKSMTAIL